MRLRLHQREPHAAVLQSESAACACGSTHLPGQRRHTAVQIRGRLAGEQRTHAGGLRDVDQHQVAARQHRDFALEGLGQQRIVERGEEDQQRAPPQVDLQAGEDFAEIRADALGAQVVDGFAAEAEMIQAAARAHEAVRAVAEGDQAEAVALALGHQRQVQRGVHVAFQNALARGQPRGIDHRVDLLRVLHAVQFHHGKGAPRGGLPVDVFEAVAGDVVAQVVELAALADLAAQAQPGVGGLQEERGGGAVAQIGIDAEGAIHGARRAHCPQAQRRRRFDVDLAQGMVAARVAVHGQSTRERSAGAQHVAARGRFRFHALRQAERQPQPERFAERFSMVIGRYAGTSLVKRRTAARRRRHDAAERGGAAACDR